LLKNDLANAFKKTNIFLNKFLQVGLYVSPKSLTISANSGEIGTTTESIKAQTTGDDLNLNFNQRYLSEPLSHISDESIVMHFAGIGRPLVIEGVNDKSLRYLVMPMNK
jgi:DNA polymerase III sliding clamp (beta) subunit (PCNA family)